MFNYKKKYNTNNGDYMYYLNCFIFYSIIGYLLETGFGIVTKTNYNSGFMNGPWTPVYGIGVVAILLLSHYFFMNLHMPRWLETMIVFFIVGIFLSCIELIGGILIEKNFNVVFWDYTKHKYHIGHYISLEMTLIWGIATVLFIYIINPLFEKIVSKIPLSITIVISIIMFLDLIYTFTSNIKK